MYDLTYSIHVTSYPLYLWYHILYVWQHKTVFGWYHTRHMCDIICTTDVITSTLSLQTTVFMMSHPLQAWHHTHSIRCRTHCIFVITTSPLISYSLLFDIIPTFVWHHTHYMDDIICTLHNNMSTPYVITQQYLCHQSLYIWNHIQYVGPHIHYTCDFTATNLCHHSHSIENITHALYDIRLG